MDEDAGTTSALIARSLCWDRATVIRTPTAKPRKRFADEAMRWQLASQLGSWAEIRAHINQTRRKRTIPPYNRLVEVHGVMGAIGEQAGLCWTIEQDAQRVIRTARNRGQEHQTVLLRALAESASHFLLGAAHSLGNLGLRLSLLDTHAAASIQKARPKAGGFLPGVDDRAAWLTLHEASKLLSTGTGASTNKYLKRISASIAGLSADQAFKQLDERRGMDYHRRRPQSVSHASPKQGTVDAPGTGTVTISMVGATLDPEADAHAVYDLLVAAMGPLQRTMATFRGELPKCLRASGIIYHERLRLPRDGS